jgi:protease I
VIEMDKPLESMKVAFLTANEGVERVELEEPRRALVDAGAEVTLLAPAAEPIATFDHLDRAGEETADRAVGSVAVGDFDALVLPGGVANPDQLRTDDDAVRFVKAMVEAGKPVAVICHGPWTLVEAGVLDGRTLTSWPSVRTDIENAGGRWVDEEVVVDDAGPGPIVSSRKPHDLPAFNRAAIEAFSAVRAS